MENEQDRDNSAGERDGSGMNTKDTGAFRREPVVVAEQPARPVNPEPDTESDGDGWSHPNSPRGQSGTWGQSGSGSDPDGYQGQGNQSQGNDRGRAGNPYAPDSGLANGQPGTAEGERSVSKPPVYQTAPPSYARAEQSRGPGEGPSHGQNDSQGGNYSYQAQYQTQYQTQYQNPVQEKNTLSTVSMVMGILSLVGCCCGWVGIVFGVLGIIFALMSKEGAPMNGQAKAGFILSIISIVLSIIGIILVVVLEIFAVLPELWP